LYNTNHTWLKTPDGYIYSSWVQPVNEWPLNPTVPVGEGGLWGQITVPKTFTRSGPSDTSYRNRAVYYSSVHRIVAAEADYYKVQEIYGTTYWLRANEVRIIDPGELAPINAHVPPDQKHAYVSLRDQRLRCYEGDALVAEFKVSTGMPGTPTPVGEFAVHDKRIGQRMTGGLGAGAYNLPGIPYICYFTRRWAATHGCYWHNDFGRLHSNGCVNLLPEDAKWFFRWTTPVANYFAFNTKPDANAGMPGTRIEVGA
jgi:lipoprotein-anchoring transpeptidase ErfK/SrfK